MLSFPHGDDIVVVRVEGLAERRGPYEEARHLYTDLSQRVAARWQGIAQAAGDATPSNQTLTTAAAAF